MGAKYVLFYATLHDGVHILHYTDTADGRRSLLEALGKLSSNPFVVFYRIFREDTEAVVAELCGRTLVAVTEVIH